VAPRLQPCARTSSITASAWEGGAKICMTRRTPRGRRWAR
jgi:hypothetical protein